MINTQNIWTGDHFYHYNKCFKSKITETNFIELDKLVCDIWNCRRTVIN